MRKPRPGVAQRSSFVTTTAALSLSAAEYTPSPLDLQHIPPTLTCQPHNGEEETEESTTIRAENPLPKLIRVPSLPPPYTYN